MSDKTSAIPRYRVLALDLDGTLTNSKKEITSATQKALEEAALAGVKIVLASGRPLMGMTKEAKQLDLKRLDGYIEAGNGAQLYSCKTDEIIFTSAVKPEYIPEIEQIAEKFDMAALCYDDEGIISSRPDAKYVLRESFNTGLSIKKVDSLTGTITWPAPKIMIVGDPEKLAVCRDYSKRYFEGRLNIFLSEAYFMECTSLGNTKASGLERLLEHLGYAQKDLMAIGDAFNDLSMIEYAACGVAMGNSYPEIKSAADAVTSTNDEDGVARAVYEHIFGKAFPST